MSGWQKTNRNRLPRTSQTTSFDGNNRDDGGIQTGWVGTTRFVATGKNTVYDRATALEWIQQPELIIPGGPIGSVYTVQVAHGDWANSHAYIVGDLCRDPVDLDFWVCIVAHTSSAGPAAMNGDQAAYWVNTVWTASAADLTTPAPMTWANAIDNSWLLNYCGHTDWYLPNVRELDSIYDYGAPASPRVDPLFVNTQIAYYWTSSTYTAGTASAWLVAMGTGTHIERSVKTNTYCPRPCRGGRRNV